MTVVLTLNSGSSSLKACLFGADGTRHDWRYDAIGTGLPHAHAAAFDALLHDLDGQVPDVIGHRFVHGGAAIEAARRLDAAEIERLRGITTLAPLHMPGNLLGVTSCQARFEAPQVACFDTAFHQTLPELAWRLPIPQACGIRRYGFHGLNYASVAARLPTLLGPVAHGRVVVAHLGAGASLCLLEDMKSVDTTMGYTPAGGIPMATRSGDLDPGVMLELATHYDSAALSDMVYNHMGLLALSGGESSEMRFLLESRSNGARFAVDYFCRAVRGAIGEFAARSGGINALIFSGGIGENAPSIREQICEPLGFLGFKIDRVANARKPAQDKLHAPGSRPILRIAADEETVIRDLATTLLNDRGQDAARDRLKLLASPPAGS